MPALPRISAERLSKLVKSEGDSLAVVDVRDDDHIGGHIHNSLHHPARTIDDNMLDLVRDLADKEVVVFHCALSQQRGPGAAQAYLRWKDKWSTKSGEHPGNGNQEVYVLDGGFVKWQERYDLFSMGIAARLHC